MHTTFKAGVINKRISNFLKKYTPPERGDAFGYLIAIVLLSFALLARFAIAPAEAGMPFLTFFPAVTLAAVLCGMGPGLLAMILGAAVASYLFIPPFNSLTFQFHAEVIWLNVVFFAEELTVIAVVEMMYRHRSNFVSAKDLLDQIRTAKQELDISAVAFEAQEAILITDANSVILRVNQAFIDSTGYSSEDVIGQTPRLFQSGRHDNAFYAAMWECIRRTGTWQGEVWGRRKNGEIYPKILTISAVKANGGTVTHYVGMQTDITARKAAEETIKDLAYFDPLTHLPNRRLLLDRLHQAKAASLRSGHHGALMFLDLDHFKTLNDSKGHHVGDLLLRQVGDRILSCIRECDTVARMGGDEFVVMLTDLDHDAEKAASQSTEIGKKILEAVGRDYSLEGDEHHCTASLGITLFNKNGSSVDDLIRQSDIAMYQAKSAGRNALRLFNSSMQQSISDRAALENDLRRAISGNQFKLYFQVQCTHRSQIVGAEVLLRWQHPQRGLLLPEEFIPLAEDKGLIQSIERWVLETACEQLVQWQKRPEMQGLQLAINVSGHQFRNPEFAELIIQTLKNNEIPPEKLKIELELTESVALVNVEDAIEKIRALKAYGVRFSMDDFGTGYSSLAYIARLPFDQIKIAQPFVSNIGVNPADALLVQTIIGMTKSLGIAVMAEGVETEEQRLFLEQHGCPICQGFLFGEPEPPAEFEKRFELIAA